MDIVSSPTQWQQQYRTFPFTTVMDRRVLHSLVPSPLMLACGVTPVIGHYSVVVVQQKTPRLFPTSHFFSAKQQNGKRVGNNHQPTGNTLLQMRWVGLYSQRRNQLHLKQSQECSEPYFTERTMSKRSLYSHLPTLLF